MTNLLGKRVKFIWTDNCQKSFEKLRAILKSATVLLAPSFVKEFKLAVDANDVGAGSVLLQEDDNGADHSVCYYSRTFNKHQRNGLNQLGLVYFKSIQLHTCTCI